MIGRHDDHIRGDLGIIPDLEAAPAGDIAAARIAGIGIHSHEDLVDVVHLAGPVYGPISRLVPSPVEYLLSEPEPESDRILIVRRFVNKLKERNRLVNYYN